MKAIFVATALLIGINSDLHATCATLIKGPVTIDVSHCNSVHPERAFPLTESKYSFIRALPPLNREALFESYRGLLIRGLVTRSMAIRTGISKDKGALRGERILAFIPPQATTCQAIQSRRIQAFLDEVCCEGGGEAPCLLGSSYVLKKPELVASGVAATAQGSSQHAEQLAAYRQAANLLQQKDHKAAIAVLEKLRTQHSLDIQGHYLFGLAYRESDRCRAALPHLETVYKHFEKNDYGSDEEVFIRRGTLLLARCYSILSRSGEAVMVLQAFLVEPKRFRKEILESLSHDDFGYIRTDKNYVDYRNSATDALAQ